MDNKITCFYSIKNTNNIEKQFQISGKKITVTGFENLMETRTVRLIAETVKTDYTLIYTGFSLIELGEYALERMLGVVESTGAGLLYTDCFKIKDGIRNPHPHIDYKEGSLRDDFDFGSVLLYRTDILKKAVSQMQENYRFAALYDLRLKVSLLAPIIRLPEILYTEHELDIRTSGEKQFDYVDQKNREVQIEMEQVCTAHLKEIKAWLPPKFTTVDISGNDFPVESTIVIPVRNREKTIEDAVRSALSQQTSFLFNVIVVDNHSNDKTTEILQKISAEDHRLIHLIPERSDLGIGGCWNTAIMHPLCGKFAIQLDSDDLYIDEHVIARMVAAFYEQQCIMLIGSYQMVNFHLEEIPPGLIDHREWTSDNGRNNALRINGLGAPRAFYTPVLREIKMPNVSYGEDYATALAISRKYLIGRIYDPLYLCRRWEENSDASLNVKQLNEYNAYKDMLRTIELNARKKDCADETNA